MFSAMLGGFSEVGPSFVVWFLGCSIGIARAPESWPDMCHGASGRKMAIMALLAPVVDSDVATLDWIDPVTGMLVSLCTFRPSRRFTIYW